VEPPLYPHKYYNLPDFYERMTTDATLSSAGTVERLITTDIGSRRTISPIVQGVETAGQSGGSIPPVLAAAQRLCDELTPEDVVIILTGFPIPPMMISETDGPPGAVALSRAIIEGLDANVIVGCDPGAVEICSATARAGGLSVVSREKVFESRLSVAVEPVPSGLSDAEAYASKLANLEPTALIAIEKVGPNREGVYHNMAGIDVSDASAEVRPLFDQLDDIITVAVGDGGNEVGMGSIESIIRDAIDHGAKCRCECRSGIACSLETDLLVPAAVSNWGAYGIIACMSLLLDRDLLHDPTVEARMLMEASLAGAVDGLRGGTLGWCDGIPPTTHEATVRLLREVIRTTKSAGQGGVPVDD